VPTKVSRLTRGSFQLLRGLTREPALLADLPQWIKDAPIRKDPLEHRRPWWNYKAVRFVESHLPEHARVFEYGGGASTLWLLDQGATVTTVEDNSEWLDRLRRRIPDGDLRFIPAGPADHADANGSFDAYAEAILGEPDDSFDLVIVDGRARRDCVLAAAPKVKPGGMLLLDDSQWSDTEPPARSNLHRLRAPYADLPDELSNWPVHHLRGIKPGTWLPVQTSIWLKPFATGRGR
jgi:hypothetical protein